jgi:hypothetical protein
MGPGSERGHDEHPLDVRIRGRWLPMTATALAGPEQADDIVPLLDVYLRRFPRAASTLGEGSTRERAERAVVVRCRPR